MVTLNDAEDRLYLEKIPRRDSLLEGRGAFFHFDLALDFNEIDAVHRLTSADRIIRIPANKPFDHKGAILTGLSPLFAAKKGLPENRYNHFFEKMNSDKQDLVVTIGSINDQIPHAVKSWNSTRQDNKISIIMVFPAAMKNHMNDYLQVAY